MKERNGESEKKGMEVKEREGGSVREGAAVEE